MALQTAQPAARTARVPFQNSLSRARAFEKKKEGNLEGIFLLSRNLP